MWGEISVAEQWPKLNTDILLAGYSPVENSHTQNNKVQSGALRFELLTDVVPMNAKITLNLSSFDFQLFDGWFKKTIAYGSKSFIVPLKVGMGVVDHECYFLGPYVPSPIGQRWKVSATLIAIQKQYNTDADIDQLMVLAELTDDLYNDQFFIDFDTFLNVTLPDAWENIQYGTDFS